MTVLDLVLHVPLDRVVAGQSLDLSLQGRPVRLTGAPVPMVDTVVGVATRFFGQDGMTVVLGGLGTGQPDFTLSLWLRLDQLPVSEAFVLGLGGAAGLQWRVGPDGLARLAGVRVPVVPGGWRHWALTHQAGQMTLYVDGDQVTAATPAALTLADTVLHLALPPKSQVAAGFAGSLAHLRVHARALTAGEIAAMQHTDRQPRAVLQQDNPLDLRLLDRDDQPTLYIVDGAGGESLTLEVVNVSTRPVAFAPAGSLRSVLDLTFRPKTLRLPGAVHLRGAEGWRLTGPQRNADGTVTLSLWADRPGAVLEPGAAFALTLDQIAADPDEGARVSRVELGYRGFAFADGAGQAVAGSRVKVISIASHSGRPHPPLAFGFRDQGRIFPGPFVQDNQLRLSLTNTDPSRPLRFHPATDTNPGSEVVLAFETEAEGQATPRALCKAAAVPGMAVTVPPGWTAALDNIDLASPQWVLRPDMVWDLEPGAALDIDLAQIIGADAPGRAPLRLIYRRLPGFWDGELRLEVDKTALYTDTQGHVGIGTTSPSEGLSLVHSGNGAWLGLHGVAGDRLWQVTNQAEGLTIAEGEGGGARFFVAPGGHGIGIGTAYPNPDSDLHITRAATDGNGAPQVMIEAAAGAMASPTLQIKSASGAMTLGLGGSAGGDAVIETKTGAVQLVSGWGRVGVDTAGAWAGDAGGMRPTSGYTALTVYGEAKFTGYVYADTLLMGKYDTRINRYPHFLSVSTYDAKAAWAQNLDPRNLMINPKAPNGEDFVLLNAMSGGVLAVSDGGQSPYPQLYWNTSAVVVQNDLRVGGRMSAREKLFDIAHPQTPGARLVHACLEGPENAVYYRGEAQLTDGQAVVTLPGYFEALTRRDGRTVQLTAKGRTPYLLSYDDVQDGQFHVYGTLPDGRFSWEVRAVRADLDALVTEPGADK